LNKSLKICFFVFLQEQKGKTQAAGATSGYSHLMTAACVQEDGLPTPSNCEKSGTAARRRRACWGLKESGRTRAAGPAVRQVESCL